MPDHDASFDIGHPAPHRESVNRWLLIFGLFGGIAAWSLQFNAGAALSGIFCTGGDGPAGQTYDGTFGVLLAINIAALAASAASLWAAYQTLISTGHTREGDTGGLLDAGEGRTRFLAIWAVFTSLLFTIAVGFNALTVLWGPKCG